jgi:hypothetical protein
MLGRGRLRYGYRGCNVWIFIVFGGVKHVELGVTLAATSDDDQCDDRGNHEGKGSEDDTNNDRGDMRATGWCVSTISAPSWYGDFSLGVCLRTTG